MAVGVDIRNRDFAVGPVLQQLDSLAANPRFALTLLFVDCDDEVLVRRYTETRRRHPLAQGRPVADGIALERRLVAPLRERADLVIDSSQLTPADLRRQRSEEHTSELQSLMRTSYAVSCLKKKNITHNTAQLLP